MDIQKISIQKLKSAKYNPRKDLQPSDEEYQKIKQNVEYICGMSVPPIMMKKIANQIKLQLLDKLKT